MLQVKLLLIFYFSRNGPPNVQPFPNHWDKTQVPDIGYKVMIILIIGLHRRVTCNNITYISLYRSRSLIPCAFRNVITVLKGKLRVFSSVSGRKFCCKIRPKNTRRWRRCFVRRWPTLTSWRSRGFRTRVSGTNFSCTSVGRSEKP